MQGESVMANPHPEPHPENLRPIPKGTTEIQRKGGKASAKANAKRRTMREWAEFYANLPLRKDGKVKDPKAAEDIRDTNLTMEGAVLAAMYNKAIKGDVRAAEFVLPADGPRLLHRGAHLPEERLRHHPILL